VHVLHNPNPSDAVRKFSSDKSTRAKTKWNKSQLQRSYLHATYTHCVHHPLVLHHPAPPNHQKTPPKIIGRCQCRARSCQPAEWGLSGVKLVRLAVVEFANVQNTRILVHTSMCQILSVGVNMNMSVNVNVHGPKSSTKSKAPQILGSVQAAHCWPIIYA